MSSSNANTVYGGDEINAIILDIGSHTIRIGYAGDDFPKIITTSHYGTVTSPSSTSTTKDRVFGESLDVLRKGGTQVHRIVENSLIVDWDAAFELFEHYFKLLKIEQRDQPILITEPIWSTTDYRAKLIGLIFEKFEFPAVYLAKVPSCISFQQGRPNCLVVDVGCDSVSVTPVVDGICLIKSTLRTPYAGKFLDNVVQDFFEAPKKVAAGRDKGDEGDKETQENGDKTGDVKLAVEPSVLIKSKTPTMFPEPAKFELKKLSDGVEITPSFRNFQNSRIWHEFKETMLEVPSQDMNKKYDAGDKSIFAPRAFELPTGQSITLGAERFSMADTIFQPESYQFHNLHLKPPLSNGEIPGIELNTIQDYRPLKRQRKNEEDEEDDSQPSIRGLIQLITHVISIIDIDLRAGLSNNIIVSGGGSLVMGLTERLYHELSSANPGLKIRLHAVGNAMERINQSWIGASVLASLGSFHQMWVSEKEWNEEGEERILNQRFR
ncbi:uncharacterized protein LODBEIA_P40400 [Lodderomyces beijingensis]|uniref:Actin-related protein 4 n=1 Tax=Lodderomyces beijingensis TaxID=1775926 RepID=A0ABP0ZRV0_9ASCO